MGWLILIGLGFGLLVSIAGLIWLWRTLVKDKYDWQTDGIWLDELDMTISEIETIGAEIDSIINELLDRNNGTLDDYYLHHMKACVIIAPIPAATVSNANKAAFPPLI